MINNDAKTNPRIRVGVSVWVYIYIYILKSVHQVNEPQTKELSKYLPSSKHATAKYAVRTLRARGLPSNDTLQNREAANHLLEAPLQTHTLPKSMIVSVCPTDSLHVE